MRLEQDAVKFAVGSLGACPALASEPDEKLSAITDFAYNLGLGALRSSTLRKRINARRWTDVPAELNKWVNAGGRKLRGLVIRRKAEAELFMKGDRADA
jgi:lysozyme